MGLSHTDIKNTTQRWFEQAVLGLNLCPFAAKPWRENRIEFRISDATTDDSLLHDVLLAGQNLSNDDAIETTLLIVPHHLDDFFDYNQFLNAVDALFQQMQWEGVFQIASFHPHYQFSGTEPDDLENFTNRAPFPIFHFLREASLEKALAHYDNPEAIPENNIVNISALSDEQRRAIFPYIFQSP